MIDLEAPQYVGTRYKIAIRKNETGETRLYDFGKDCPWMEGSYGWLESGNYSCDCNRELAFERAAGREIDDERCTDGRFSILYAEFPDGTRIPIDD